MNTIIPNESLVAAPTALINIVPEYAINGKHANKTTVSFQLK